MSQILSQNEVDALLQAVTEGKVETETGTAKTIIEPTNIDYVKFDFTRKRRFVKGDMPTVDLIFSLFAKELEVQLINQTQQSVTLNFVSNEIINYNEYVNRLPSPIGMFLVEITPALCKGILSMETSLIYHILNLFFGGKKGGEVNEDKTLTEIELNVASKVANSALFKLEEVWNKFAPMEMSIEKIETDPNYIAVFPADEMILLATWEVNFTTVKGNLHLVLSLKAIDTLEDSNLAIKRKPSKDSLVGTRLKSHLEALFLKIAIELGSAEMNVNNLLKLKVGDIIPITTDKEEKLIMNIEGIPKFTAAPGAYRGKKAVKIEAPITVITEENQ